jgi:hypothetical protein
MPFQHDGIPCIGTVHSEAPIDGNAFHANLSSAREIFAQRGIMTAAQFCAAFDDLDVYVVDADRLEPGGPVGRYVWPVGIYTERTGRAAVHELLHVWDVQHGALMTGSHDGWETNGYNAAYDQWWQTAKRVDR